MANFGDVQEEYHEFIVIGAGISGMQAGILLAQNDKDFLILEATNKIGGRIGTDKLYDILQEEFKEPQKYPEWLFNNKRTLNTPVQYGATWVSEEHFCMLKLIKQLKIRVFPQHYEGLSIYGKSEGKYEAAKSLGQLFKNYQTQIQQFLNKIQKIKQNFLELKSDLRANQDKLSQLINTYDSVTVQDFIVEELKNDPFAYEIINEIQTLQCINGDKFSMMQLLHDDSSLQMLKFYTGNVENTIDGLRIENGMLAVVTQMFNKILKQIAVYHPQKNQDEIIQMNCPVVKIDNLRENQIKVYVKNSNKVYKCRKVFLSAPVAVIKQIQITKISPSKKLIFDNQEIGILNRVYFVFQTAFWRDKFSGYGAFGHALPFNEITDLSPANLACGVLAYVFVGDRYQKWVKQTPDAQKRFQYLKGVIADVFAGGDRNSAHMKNCFSFRRTFSTNPYIQASYQATTKKEVWKQINQKGQDYVQNYQKDENDIIYIGTQFALEFPTYMEGAIRNARQKTHQILRLQDPWRNLMT